MQGEKMKTNFMVFIAGDNDLDSDGYADLDEMFSVDNLGDSVTLLIQYDKSEESQNSSTIRYVKQYDSRIEEDIGETNTGDSYTLSDFMNWGIENYPADRNILILWNHGGGTLDEEKEKYFGNVGGVRTHRSIGKLPLFSKSNQAIQADAKAIFVDDESRDFLDNIELKKAFVESDKSFDIIGFDACVMGMIEVTYQIREYTDYIIASQEDEPKTGWDYHAILDYLVKNPDCSNAELSQQIVSSYIDTQKQKTDQRLTLSTVRSDKLESITCHMNCLAHALLEHCENELLDDMRTIYRRNSVNSVQRFYQGRYIDLYHFVQLLTKIYSSDQKKNSEIVQCAKKLLAELDALIIDNQTHNITDAYGVSVFLPYMRGDVISQVALKTFDKLDINLKKVAPYWHRLFYEIADIDQYDPIALEEYIEEKC